MPIFSDQKLGNLMGSVILALHEVVESIPAHEGKIPELEAFSLASPN